MADCSAQLAAYNAAVINATVKQVVAALEMAEANLAQQEYQLALSQQSAAYMAYQQCLMGGMMMQQAIHEDQVKVMTERCEAALMHVQECHRAVEDVMYQNKL